jgi:hypothetical protein
MSTLAALTMLLAQASAPPPAMPTPRAGAPEEAPAEDTDPRLIFGWTAIGVGGAAALAGTVMAVLSFVRYEGLDCEDNLCPPGEHDDARAYNDLRVPSGVLLIGGLLVAGIGVPFVVLGDAEREDAALVLGPGTLTLRGRF